MNKLVLILSTLTIIVIVTSIIVYASTQGVDVLEPAGAISAHQRNLFVLAVGLGLTAFIPVLVMAYIIIHRYHTGNIKSAKRHSRKFQIKSEATWIWGGFVTVIIMILTVIMFKSTYAIDPYNPLSDDLKPVQVRVVALPWKWLFIYPEENIATINELVVPEDTPISFELTADAPMSSFWIPKLGGMIYTMEGMVTKLHLIANDTGTFEGMNTEINGKGYAQMRFTTRAVSDEGYAQWLDTVRHSELDLDATTYEQLSEPTVGHSVQHYATSDPALFGRILSKFMNHSSHQDTTGHGAHQTH